MTISNVLARVDTLCPNTCPVSEKISWVSQLDGEILEFMRGYEDGRTEVVLPYTEGDVERELLVPFPYDGMYVHFVFAMICYSMGEYAKYENALLLFNDAMQRFRIHYNQTHMPVQPRKRVL